MVFVKEHYSILSKPPTMTRTSTRTTYCGNPSIRTATARRPATPPQVPVEDIVGISIQFGSLYGYLVHFSKGIGQPTGALKTLRQKESRACALTTGSPNFSQKMSFLDRATWLEHNKYYIELTFSNFGNVGTLNLPLWQLWHTKFATLATLAY